MLFRDEDLLRHSDAVTDMAAGVVERMAKVSTATHEECRALVALSMLLTAASMLRMSLRLPVADDPGAEAIKQYRRMLDEKGE